MNTRGKDLRKSEGKRFSEGRGTEALGYRSHRQRGRNRESVK